MGGLDVAVAALLDRVSQGRFKLSRVCGLPRAEADACDVYSKVNSKESNRPLKSRSSDSQVGRSLTVVTNCQSREWPMFAEFFGELQTDSSHQMFRGGLHSKVARLDPPSALAANPSLNIIELNG
jgi:hypothetical protein